eukprot:4553065-Pyramimonas_sp.AAC.1
MCLLSPSPGSFLTFGALSAGRESAPGQPTLGALAGMYRCKLQTKDTPVLGVIGKPVSHSRSPALHNAYAALHTPLHTPSTERCLVRHLDLSKEP